MFSVMEKSITVAHWDASSTKMSAAEHNPIRKLPGDLSETFSESILQLLSLCHHIINKGHQLSYGGH